MNEQAKYTQFALAREMMETPAILRGFRAGAIDAAAEAIRKAGRLFLTGEGSSRIFPAKNAMMHAMRRGLPVQIATEGGRQAAEYRLDSFVVFGASNSGRTKEVISLFEALGQAGHPHLYGLTANAGTKLESLARQTFMLGCGKEDAVAATKSVAEQALFYQTLLARLEQRSFEGNRDELAVAYDAALRAPIPAEMIAAIAQAGTIHFAGRNDGVAEELALKTNEITRKAADFLEGTYAVHGIEEVMDPRDVVIVVDPIVDEVSKFRDVLEKGVGMHVFAISGRNTGLSTLQVPEAGEMDPYVFLAAGWNLLVEIGLYLDINLDKAQRARKIGNEVVS